MNALSFLLALNVVTALSFLFLKGLFFIGGRFFNYRSRLKLHGFGLVAALVFSIGTVFIPRSDFFEPPVKIWSEVSLVNDSSAEPRSESENHEKTGFLTFGDNLNLALGSQRFHLLTNTLSVLLAVSALFGVFIFVRDARRMHQLHKKSWKLRSIGRTEIRASDNVSVPYSYWINSAVVMLPEKLVSQALDLKMAIQHELQHHRQGDTLRLYLISFLRIFGFANPFIHMWAREIFETQEYACDEALIDLGKVNSYDYARCLVEVAETASGFDRNLVCATGMAFMSRKPILERRINTMLFQKSIRTNGLLVAVVTAGLLASVAAGAYASTGLMQDRRITMVDAQKMISKTQSTSDIPIVLNSRVLRALNKYIGTPEGREYMRESLSRMALERGPIDTAMKEYGVPSELIAMAIVESGFRNLPQKSERRPAAGLWQFIPSTARAYGLLFHPDWRKRTDRVRDQRLDVELETDAAMRLLVANKMRFKDWLLSVSAYNAGENRVQEGIEKTGSRNAWDLVGAGFEGDDDYLAKLTAAILIMNNPESVQ